MKRKMFALACALLAALTLLAGCGAASSSTATGMEMDAATGETYGMESFSQTNDKLTGTADSAAVSSPEQPENGAKLIYTAGLDLETTGFDAAAEGLETLAESLGGYVEQSDVYAGGGGYRFGSYTVRVPAEKFSAFCTQAGELCHVTGKSTSVQDISEAYYDTAGRLKTQQTKLERLQTLLSKADKMEDIIALESAISETEQAIDDLSGTVQHYDQQVNFATVNISLNEVYKLSNTEEPADSFISRLGTALSSGAKGFVTCLQGALVTLAYGWVWVVLVAGVAVAAVVTVKKRRRRKNALPKTTAEDDKNKTE